MVLLEATREFLDRRGLWDEQLQWFHAALHAARRLSRPHDQAATLNNIGGVHYVRGEWDQALDYYRKALPIRREAGDRVGEAATLNNIGMVHHGRGEGDQALVSLEQLVAVEEVIGHPSLEGNRRALEALRAQVSQEGGRQKPGR